jgi:penicillin G amidase
MAEALSAPAPTPLPVRRPRRLLRRLGLGLAIFLGVLLLAVLAGGFWFRSRMEESLPQLAGEAALPGLAAAVEVERDALGVPTIRAASREDAARALGFLHAQDRFFQMDLLRRSAAGELAEVVGSAVVDSDREIRLHRFRHVAGQVVAQALPQERAFLEAYTEGVNAGLSALGGKPFEYILLGVEPAPWRPEDTILAVFAMFIDLQDEDGSRESELGFLHDTLPREMFDFLSLPGTEWDAPLEGEPFAVPPVPGPAGFDLRKAGAARSLPKAARRSAPSAEPAWNEAVLGSNNWAVAGTHTAHGRALLANDMHLEIRVPNTWYRASIVRPDGAGGTLRLTGMTLPGTPSIVVGSNGHVAWGFTNTYGDWSDIVLLEADPRQPGTYRTPAGLKAFRTVTETIRVKGAEPVTLEVKETIWGPVIDPDHRGRQRAFAWTAHHAQAVNLGIQGMETARTVEEAMAVANRSGIPAQNFVVADATGRVGWTVMGRIPRRVGFSGRIPTSWADGSRRWDGWLAPEEVPRVVAPPSGRVWTANARAVGGEALAKLGDGGYDLGARSRQIRDGLFALGKATPRDMLALQLDDRALFLERWRKLLLDTLTPEAVAADPRRSELRRLVETTWTGRASVDSVAYRIVRSFRLNLAGQVFTSLTGQGDRPEAERFGPTRQFEGWLWRLVTERPVHLLDPQFESWDEQLLAAVDETLGYFAERGKLADRTWGERNTSSFAHPLSAAVPFLGRWLDVPARALPGDENMPRFQSAYEGASERMVVSPGAEEAGLFHMPVGQSGHPLSPYYRAGHDAWERGEPTPFLPGPAEHRLRLVPK